MTYGLRKALAVAMLFSFPTISPSASAQTMDEGTWRIFWQCYERRIEWGWTHEDAEAHCLEVIGGEKTQGYPKYPKPLKL